MKSILNPDLYHGKNKKNNFFEGWYFKIVDKNNLYKFAFIPGIALGNEDSHHHSFIQILDGKQINYKYLKFNKDSFRYNNKNFKICVGSNTFSLDKVSLYLKYKNKGSDKSIKGILRFKNTQKWPSTVFNPGSMGFYNYLLFMECYSQVCTINGDIEGSLEIDGKLIDFTDGKVYIEKNWGKSFPTSWIWIQSNNFENESVSVTCSLGTIPFPIKNFNGFLIGVNINGNFMPFTTINNSEINIKKFGKDVRIIAIKNHLKLTLTTHSDYSSFVTCMGPKNGHMSPLVKETLCGEVHMVLEDIKNDCVIYKGIGKSAGIEYGGNLMNIIN